MAKSLIEDTQEYVFNLLTEKLPNTFIYHNYTHTERVLRSTRELIENSEISNEEAKILELTALLHDIGYTVSTENHEEEGVKLAQAFLKEKEVEESIINAVSSCIMQQSLMKSHPTNLKKLYEMLTLLILAKNTLMKLVSF